MKFSISIITATLSGILFYFSTDFHPYWPLLWFAPIPILIYSYHYSYQSTAMAAFFAFFIGKLNALYYLDTGMPLLLILLPIILDASAFSMLILVNKRLMSKKQHWSNVLLFPALWTGYEFLLSQVSSGGALTSLAYNQLSFTPFIQVVAVTGIWGATFVLLVFASSVSYATYTKQRANRVISLLFAVLIPLLCLCYGYHRLHTAREPLTSVTIGLVSINTPHLIYDQDAIAISKQYVILIQKAAQKGAQWVVLPERFITVTQKTYPSIITLFQKAAKENHTTLVLGIAILGHKNVNAAIIINANGNTTGIYHKHHLLSPFENLFTPGKHFFNTRDNITWGVAICKDMDFLALSRHYGKAHTQLLLVPALDFDIDAWYHGRSAIMRGIENGFAVARSAAHGYLSMTDQLGRVVKLIPDFYQKNNVLVATVNLYHLHTLYSTWGDWFAWMVLWLLLLRIVFITRD